MNDWLKLAISVLVLSILFFVVAPLAAKCLMPAACKEAIDAGMRSTAVFYTDLPEFAQAEQYIEDSLAY